MACGGQQFLNQLAGHLLVVGPPAFDQRNATRQGCAVAAANGACHIGGVGHA
jgi:hypothetical protein